jgi:putative hydrolase of the HAD superfamily
VPRAVLFDVGGPLNTEVVHERMMDERIRAALVAEGLVVDDASYEQACRWAVDSFAPNAYAAVVWRLTGQDAEVAQRVYDRVFRSSGREYVFELREGIPELLRELQSRGVRLGLAANQPRATVARLDALGIGRYFSHREVSGVHGYAKPDVRLFLRCCEDLGVAPEECVMVGDRIDNDIAPARLLGMRTVLFRAGRHAAQQPRSWEELPDAEVRSVAELSLALGRLFDGVDGAPD